MNCDLLGQTKLSPFSKVTVKELVVRAAKAQELISEPEPEPEKKSAWILPLAIGAGAFFALKG